jgi:type I site-specific restriction endonuclease
MSTNKDKTINNHRQAIAGVQKHFATTPTLVLDGTPTTPKDVIATLQGAIDAIDTAAAAEKAFHDTVTAQRAAISTGNALLKALKMLVQNQLGSPQGALGDFGFTTRARQTPNEATKAAAVAKRAATRAVRHTMGKRQKANVTGEVHPAPVTPPTATKPT